MLNKLIQQFANGQSRPDLIRFIQFCSVGASGVIVDMAVLFLLVDVIHIPWPLALSKVVAAEIAMVNNFLWNDRWTFQSAPSRAQGTIVWRFLRFNAVCIIGVALAVIVLLICVHWLALNLYLANAIAIVCATAWNYLASKKFAWNL